MRIQYGGSVTPDSVDELMSKPVRRGGEGVRMSEFGHVGARARALSLSYTHTQDIDGCLVGGASLDAEKFTRIMNFQ